MDNKFFDRHADIEATYDDLPHWNQDGKLYFVTYRLGDSLPQSLLSELKLKKAIWLENHPIPWSDETTMEYHKLFSQRIDVWLDSNYGCCVLKRPEISAIVESNLQYNNRVHYLLHSYVIMCNHVHVLLELYPGRKIQKIMHSWKSYTASQINKTLGRRGQLWWHESFDRIIRDESHYNNVRTYIIKNIRQGGVRWMI